MNGVIGRKTNLRNMSASDYDFFRMLLAMEISYKSNKMAAETIDKKVVSIGKRVNKIVKKTTLK